MCIACEQDAMWFAYLKRKGLITEDGYLVEPPPPVFMAEPLESAPADDKKGVGENVDQGTLPFDDPAKG
jgi:hypothetical protein